MFLEATSSGTSVCDVYTAASELFRLLRDDSLGATLTRHCRRMRQLIEFFFFLVENGHNNRIVKPANIAS